MLSSCSPVWVKTQRRTLFSPKGEQSGRDDRRDVTNGGDAIQLVENAPRDARTRKKACQCCVTGKLAYVHPYARQLAFDTSKCYSLNGACPPSPRTLPSPPRHMQAHPHFYCKAYYSDVNNSVSRFETIKCTAPRRKLDYEANGTAKSQIPQKTRSGNTAETQRGRSGIAAAGPPVWPDSVFLLPLPSHWFFTAGALL